MLEWEVGSDWLACHITPTEDCCCECQLWHCFPKLREANVVIGDSWMATPIPVASVKGQTRLFMLRICCIIFFGNDELIVHIIVVNPNLTKFFAQLSNQSFKFCYVVYLI